jgi:addiction module HigA family antidote
MSQNFVVSPGVILKEYLSSRNITQKQLAQETGKTEKQISNLVNGKIKISEDLALKLEKIFEDVKAEFWMDLENSYRLYLLRNKEGKFSNLSIVSKQYSFKTIFSGLNLSLEEQASRMLKILEVNSFDEVKTKIAGLNYCFMEDGGEKESIYLWLKLCEEEIEIQNNLEKMPKFNESQFNESIPNFKDLILTQDFEIACKNLRRFLNELGVALVILEAIPNSKIRGATSRNNNNPVIFLSTRFKSLGSFYFALLHEIFHIKKGDTFSISPENEDELEINSVTRDYFIEKDAYQKFIDGHPTQELIQEGDIIVFSKQQKVVPEVFIGFLEHDKIIDYQKFNYLKGKIGGVKNVRTSFKKSAI